MKKLILGFLMGFLVVVLLASVASSATVGSGVTQTQSGVVSQTQVGGGFNTQGYTAGGTQGYLVGAAATKLGFGTMTSAAGLGGGMQSTLMQGGQVRFGQGQSQTGVYGNTQSFGAFAY